MSRASQVAHRAEVKLALADKYARLVKISNSKPRREKWMRLSEKYRRQSVMIANG